MHRISSDRKVKNTLLEKEGLLITGWGSIASAQFLHDISGKGKEDFGQICANALGVTNRNRFCLYLFLNEFKKGDYVVVPYGNTFSIYEIVEDKPHPKADLASYVLKYPSLVTCNGSKYVEPGMTRELDLGFFWKVKTIDTGISKHGYASNKLQKRLKYQMTNIEMTDLRDDIEEALKRKNSDSPINLKEEIVGQLTGVVIKKLTDRINDHAFEKVVKWYLEEIGADEATIPAKNKLPEKSGDADIIALFNELNIVIFVQVKQYSKIVDKKAVEQIVKAYKWYADEYKSYSPHLWVVTTCNTFDQDSLNYAAKEHVRCITGEEFARMILDVGLKNMGI